MLKQAIWITGCEGRIGSALTDLLKQNRTYAIVATDRDVDITDREVVEQAADLYQPAVIINCASISDSEYCENNRVEAYRVNALGARNLAVATRRKNATIIHLSSDDVFSGEKLLQTSVHFSKQLVYKSKNVFPDFQQLQMVIVGIL